MLEESISKKQAAIAGAVVVLAAAALLIARQVSRPRAARLVPNTVTLEVERVADAPARGGVMVRVEPPDTMLLATFGNPWLGSADRGRTWAPRPELPRDLYGAMAWSNQTLHLVWEQLGSVTPLTPNRLMHREGAGGASQVIFEGTTANAAPERLGMPVLAALDDGLLMVFARTLPQNFKLHAMRYSAGAWTDLGDLPDSDHDWLQAPSLAVDGAGNVSLAFVRRRFVAGRGGRGAAANTLEKRELTVLRSKDRGATWAEVASDLGGNSSDPDFESYGAQSPQLFAGADQVTRLVWVHAYGKVERFINATQRHDVLMAQSKNGGRWSNPVQVNDAVLSRSELLLPTQKSFGELASDVARYGVTARSAASPSGRYLAAVWRDFRAGAAVLTYSVSTDGGNTWTQNQPIAPAQTAGAYVTEVLLDDQGELTVFWQANEAVYLARGRF